MSQPVESPVPEPLGRHPLDLVSLVAGALAVLLALAALVDVDLDGDVVVPAVLLALGAAGLAAALRRR